MLSRRRSLILQASRKDCSAFLGSTAALVRLVHSSQLWSARKSSPIRTLEGGSSFLSSSLSLNCRRFASSVDPTVVAQITTARKEALKASGIMSLKDFPETLNFPKMEEEILAYWQEIDAFQTSLKKSEGRPLYSFYDGPPFATGLPHYGHILAGTIKDVVCRYAHQTGHHVERHFGWDCHGLPIEFEIEKLIGIKSSHDVQAYGIANYNAKCREIVMRYAKEWEVTVNRMGRWIDFKNDYKTMNLSFMESVWWVFRRLFEKGLVYRGFKVMPYSTGCTTPLSNFECNMNYKDVSDPSLVITFPLEEDPNTQLLAWTTTPWTLPSNLGAVVHPTMTYVKVKDHATSRFYILAEARLCEVYKSADLYTVISKFPGAELKGKRYVPLFNYFTKFAKEEGGAFRVMCDTYVTADSGTGVVHAAPGFGEDDYRVSKDHHVLPEGTIVCPVDENGRFTAEVTEWAGKYIKDCDDDIAKRLKENGRLISKGSIVHSYPFCWRSETPLIYKAVEAWFVRVESFRDKLLAANLQTRWVPEFVQTKRFSNWLEDARDWNVSRNRYWGTPLPIWHSEDWEEIVCIGSVEELQQLSGRTDITDIHREFVDEITIPSKRPGVKPLRRIPQVFDCWFESGSMPYAEKHYPFENVEKFEKSFPADFIAEGLDQTRGWFYTLLVLSTALFDKPPFKNLIVNGLVLAEDGKKMSKRLKNYPEPTKVIDEHGADAIRLFLINSPVVRAEPLKFREQGVKEVVKDVFLPFINSAKFFQQQCNRFLAQGGKLSLDNRSDNLMDRWIEAAAQTLVGYVHKEMEGYRLYTVVPGVLTFVTNLSNWYVRMNRRRIKGMEGDVKDWGNALNTMFSVLMVAIRTMAPFTPFISEYVYQRLKGLLPEDQREDSIHYLMLPTVDKSRFDAELELGMNNLIEVVELIRVLRDRVKLPLKLPVRDVVVIHPNPSVVEALKTLSPYIQTEVNTFGLQFTTQEGEYITTKLEANLAAIGKRWQGEKKEKQEKGAPPPTAEEKAAKDALRKKNKDEQTALINAIANLAPAEQNEFMKNGGMTLLGHQLTMDDIKINRSFKEGIADYATNTNGEALVLMDTRKDEAQIDAWRGREFVSRVQQLRKTAKLSIGDVVNIFYQSVDEGLSASIERSRELVNETIKVQWVNAPVPEGVAAFAQDESEIGGCAISIWFTKP